MWRVVLMCLVLAVPARAETLSPWFGAEGQEPFRLDAQGRVAVVTADTLVTSSITPLAATPCSTKDCQNKSIPAGAQP